MKIQIAGPGCPRCKETHKNVINACAELDLPADIEYLTDMAKMAQLGVKITPAVIVDGKIVLSGRIPTVEELKQLLQK